MDRVPCFLLVRTDRVRLSLRKYTYATRQPCMARDSGGHEALVVVGEAPMVLDAVGQQVAPSLTDYLNDPRWPVACHGCHTPFGSGLEYEVLAERIYRVSMAEPGTSLAGGAETVLLDAPPGAVWERPVTDQDIDTNRMYVRRDSVGVITEIARTDVFRFFNQVGWVLQRAASA